MSALDNSRHSTDHVWHLYIYGTDTCRNNIAWVGFHIMILDSNNLQIEALHVCSWMFDNIMFMYDTDVYFEVIYFI